MATSPVTLFGLERSVYTRVARMALEEKGVAYELQETEIFGPQGVPSEHRARQPFGRIPVLQHGDFVLYETTAITRYVDEVFPGPALQPSAPDVRARMNQVISIVDSYGYRPMVWDVFVERVSKGGRDQATIANGLAAAERCLQALEAVVRPQPCLTGEALSLADLHLFPVLACFVLTDEGRHVLRGHAELQRWFERMRTRTAAEKTRYPLERAA